MVSLYNALRTKLASEGLACTSASTPPVVRTQEQDGTQLKVSALVNRVLVSCAGNTVTLMSEKTDITGDVICNI